MDSQISMDQTNELLDYCQPRRFIHVFSVSSLLIIKVYWKTCKMSEEKKEGYYHIVKDFFDSLGLDDSAGEPSNRNPYMRPLSDDMNNEPATLPRYRSEETCKLIVRDLKEYCRLYINLHQPHFQGARRKLGHSNILAGDNVPEVMKQQIPPMPFTVAIRRKATRVSITRTRSRKSVNKSHKRMTPSNKTSNTTYYSQSSTDLSYRTADNRRSSPSTCVSSMTNFTCFCCYHEAPLRVQCTERAVGHHVDTASKEIQVDLDRNQAGCSKDSDNRLSKRSPAFSPKKRPRALSTRLAQRRIRNVRRNPVRMLPSLNDAGTNTEDPDGLSWVFQDVQEMVTFCSDDSHQLQEICPSLTPPTEFESEIELEDDVESVISSYSSASVSGSSGLSTFSITPMTGTEMFIDEAESYQSVSFTATNSMEFTLIHQSTRSQDDKSTENLLSSSLEEFATIVDDPSSPKCSTIVSTIQSDATTYYTCSEGSDATLVLCDESEDSMDICSQIDDLERSLLSSVATITHPDQMIQEPCRRSSSTSASDLKRSFSSKFNIYFVNKESKF